MEKPFRQALKTIFDALPSKLSCPAPSAVTGYLSSDEEEALPNHSRDQYLELPLNKRTRAYMDYSMSMVEKEGRRRIDSALKQSASKKPGVGCRSKKSISDIQTYV